ncbi:hypothetical protein UFOVP1040_21 [uncultured Caudovirales phage]|uniref:Portal protein n=1 Tax=uncultured Caudovirales phage TaxID=2100421 RepID=A0A6J5QFK3_9CAUD|nr:hypothetical protein UFOVP1040_21 [uncultured Caudovirales phage]
MDPTQTNPAKQTLKFDAGVIGDTGLKQYGGVVVEEFLKELLGQKGARVYREMADNDPIVGAVLFAVTMLIRQCKFTIQAKDDSTEAEDAKTFVEEVLTDMSQPFESVIAEICSMFTYGYAPMEIVWKRRIGPEENDGARRSRFTDGKIGIRQLSLRGQSTLMRWEIDPDDGSIKGMWQQPFSRPAVEIPIIKLVLFRTTEEKNNPEGRSLLRNAYRPWYFKKRIEEIEGVGVERDLAGLPVAMIPSEYMAPDADANDKIVLAAWQRMVTQIRRDQQEGVLIPSDRDQAGNLLFDLKLLSTGGSRTFDTTKIVDRYNRAIATSVLADFIFLGQQSVGSFALSSDKTALFAAAIGAFTQSIAETFNRHLLPRLWRLNGLDNEIMPSMHPEDLEHANLAEVGQFLTAMTGAGAMLFPDRELENNLREMAGLPPGPEESEDGAGDLGAPGQTGPDLQAALAQVIAQQGKKPEGDPNAPPGDKQPPVEKSRPAKIRKDFIYGNDGLIASVIETTLEDGQ